MSSARNGYMQAYNKMPKSNSKTQINKENNKKEISYVTCENCGRHDVTLFNVDNKYYCAEHKI